jgi:hypothetical protein
MSTKNSDKNKDVIKELEKTISPILVVNNSALKPYVELFEYAPENIYQQPLGSLVGFFEIKEFSQESAYVVNFLTSVLKKEYYINPKRPVTESLDSALHKVNMALSELAKHGNIEWLGKINAAICVLEKNNAHFSVSGDAKIFLYRTQNLSEISEDLASDSLEPHPLKTFVNVSSGRLEKDDRLLITSADIFHILPSTEIKKNFQRFEGDKFVQFLKTALSNQMEMIVSIIVEMTETAVVPVVKIKPVKKSASAANAFSEQTFAKEAASKTIAEAEQHDFIADAEKQNQTQPEYTDEKTGHIYVQGEVSENIDNPHAQITLYWDMVKEKMTQASYQTKNEIRKRFSLYKKQLAKKRELQKIAKEQRDHLAAEEARRQEEERVLLEIQHQQELVQQEEELQRMKLEQEHENELQRIKMEQEELSLKATVAITPKKKLKPVIVLKEETEEIENAPARDPQSSFLEKLRLARLEQQGNAVIDLSLKNKFAEKEVEPALLEEDKTIQPYTAIELDSIEVSNIKKLKLFAKKYFEQALVISKHSFAFFETQVRKSSGKIRRQDDSLKNSKINNFDFAPHFSKIKNLFSRFSNKQKLYTLGALVLVFIVPLFIVHFLNQPAAPIAAEVKIVPPTQAELLANEKNINLQAQMKKVFTNNNIISLLIENGNPILITKTGVVVLQNNQTKEYPLPSNVGSPIRAAYMNDLSLVLILTDSNKILSFSTSSTKFTDNKINLGSISSSNFIGTYLTYLYVLDQKNNQIYRFPRAEGGFGEAINWLKDGTALAGVSDMTIDDNIYAIANNQILKFFKGQKQSFTVEASNTPIHFDKIYTTPDLSFFYALDTQNSRIIKYSKDGSILAQYYNEALKDGASLIVDEKKNLAYITTSEGLISISLQ